MPEIAPLRGLRYAPNVELTRVIAPPYDVISPEHRDELEAREPHNFVRLELEKERPGDAPGEKYRRSAAALAAWQAEGALVRDAEPSIYALAQTFTGPDGKQRTRRGFLALLKLHDFSEGVVLPHEKTLSGPKADRLEIQKAMKANLSPIFSLVPDEDDRIWKTLEPALGAAERRSATSDDGGSVDLWRITDPAVIHSLRDFVAWRPSDKAEIGSLKELATPRKAFIADGHHRYETALKYAQVVDADRGPRLQGGHRYVLSFFCGMSDPGLVIFPTHRLVHSLPSFSLETFLRLAGEYFDVKLLDGADLPGALRALTEAGGPGRHAFLAAAPDRSLRLLTLRDLIDLSHVNALPKNPTLRALDVTLLHGLLLQHVLGISPEAQEKQANLRYVKDAKQAADAVFRGEAQLGLLMNATPMWQVRAVAEAGEVMPQKSTFFFPKVPSGLVVNLLDPDEIVALPRS